MKILSVYNIKGGVGKTTTTVNLAYLAAGDGASTLVWDLDPQAAATFLFRINPKVKGGGKGLVRRKHPLEDDIKGTDYENLDLLPADFSYRNLDLVLDHTHRPKERLDKILKPLVEEYEYIFLDCPPGISLLSEAIFHATDALVIPLIPTTFSLRTFDQTVTFLKNNGVEGVEMLPFFSMVDRRKALHNYIVKTLPFKHPDMLRTSIPYASDVESMGVHRAALGSYAGRKPAALAYQALWKEIKKRLSVGTDAAPPETDDAGIREDTPERDSDSSLETQTNGFDESPPPLIKSTSL